MKRLRLMALIAGASFVIIASIFGSSIKNNISDEEINEGLRMFVGEIEIGTATKEKDALISYAKRLVAKVAEKRAEEDEVKEIESLAVAYVKGEATKEQIYKISRACKKCGLVSWIKFMRELTAIRVEYNSQLPDDLRSLAESEAWDTNPSLVKQAVEKFKENFEEYSQVASRIQKKVMKKQPNEEQKWMEIANLRFRAFELEYELKRMEPLLPPDSPIVKEYISSKELLKAKTF